MSYFNPKTMCAGFIAIVLVFAGQTAMAASAKRHNLVDLIEQSDQIFAGRVVNVTDGLTAENIPYTEVTVDVVDNVKGVADGEFSFRQFGLMEPRTMPNGKLNLMVNPDGWASFGKGEDVTLFLYPAARLTGLRTTVGLTQGKLNVINGRIIRDDQNASLFEGVEFAPGLLKKNEKDLVAKGKGRKDMEAHEFMKLVKRAVKENWVAKGNIKHEN